MLCSSLHFEYLIGILVFATGYVNAQECTDQTCLIDVIYNNPVNELWFMKKVCPPDLYSGRNDTMLGEDSIDVNSLYYFTCITCLGVSGDFASCRCYICHLQGPTCFLKGICSVRTTDEPSVVIPSLISTQTFDTIPTTTSSTLATTLESTTVTTTTSGQTTQVTETQNVTIQPQTDMSKLYAVVTIPIIFIIIILVGIIFVIILVIILLRRKKVKKAEAREPAYIEIDTTLSSIPLYTEITGPDNTHGYYIPRPTISKTQEQNIYGSIEEEVVHGFSLNNVRDLTEDMYVIISEKNRRGSQTDDPWFQNDIQMRRLNTSVNNTGTLAFLKVPSYTERNSTQIDSPGFVAYANEMPGGKTAHIYQNLGETFKYPPDTNVELYDRMSSMKLREINPDTMSITETLGTGEFGSVVKALWNSPLGEVEVAIKVLKERQDDASGEKLKTSFLQEAAILGQFSHPNILRLVGVVTLTAPNMMVTELMQEELKRFLDALQTQHNQELDYDTISPHFLSFSRQVASGMQYLAEKGCIHRDIAARNILLTDKCVCKIADFGMSRRLEAESDYYRVKGSNKLPVKWSAPEAIFFKRFTLKSDIWSYGMLLYEIWSVGRKPWPYEDNRSAVEKIARGVNLPPPAGCPRAIYELMVSTWHPKADQRPDMKDLVAVLSKSDEGLLVRDMLENRSGSTAPAFMLGSDPMAAEELYKDLQNMFLNVKN